jgi:hypothetical protein
METGKFDELSEEQKSQLIELLKKSNKIQAVKNYHNWTSKTLKQSKFDIDQICKNEGIKIKSKSILGCLGLVLIVFIIIAVIVGLCDSPGNTKEYTKAQQDSINHVKWVEAQFNAWDGSHKKSVEMIKQQLYDPESFKHLKTVYYDYGYTLVIQTTYTGTNLFGARVKQTIKTVVDSLGQITEFRAIDVNQ